MQSKSIPLVGISIRATVLALLSASVFCSVVSAGGHPPAQRTAVIARVNGKPVSTNVLNEKLEELYPTASVHGGRETTPELREKAIAQVIVEELIWQQAVRTGKVVPLAQAERQMRRFRRDYGARQFDDTLRQHRISRQGYARKLQRALTIQRARKEHVETHAQVAPEAVRAYYEANRNRFRRPERARVRLILVAVEPDSPEAVERQASKKADDLYAQLKAGKDFADVASEFSDDVYRVMGGDVGWMHKGSMDPEFETLAFSLPVGQFTAPFRTPLGYNILKVEGREPGREMSFDEIQGKLKLQLEMQKAKRLSEMWEAGLKKKATIQILTKNAGLMPNHAAQRAGTQPAGSLHTDISQ